MTAPAALPHIDEHSAQVERRGGGDLGGAAAGRRGLGLRRPAPGFARALGCADTVRGRPAAARPGSTIPGFHVAARRSRANWRWPAPPLLGVLAGLSATIRPEARPRRAGRFPGSAPTGADDRAAQCRTSGWTATAPQSSIAAMAGCPGVPEAPAPALSSEAGRPGSAGAELYDAASARGQPDHRSIARRIATAATAAAIDQDRPGRPIANQGSRLDSRTSCDAAARLRARSAPSSPRPKGSAGRWHRSRGSIVPGGCCDAHVEPAEMRATMLKIGAHDSSRDPPASAEALEVEAG